MVMLDLPTLEIARNTSADLSMLGARFHLSSVILDLASLRFLSGCEKVYNEK